METKIYSLRNLGCANCAAKMEAKINALPRVKEATITFATRQLRVVAEDPDALLPQMQQICQSIESEVEIAQREEHHHHEHHEHHGHHDHCGRDHDHCGCDHDHHAHEHHDEEEADNPEIGRAHV